jgi:hypothetical protein
MNDEKAQSDYDKVQKIIISCKTLDQLEIAKQVAHNYNIKYKGYISNIGLIFTAKLVFLKSQED